MKEKDYYKKSIEECFIEFDSKPAGLGEVQAAGKLSECKKYAIKPQKRSSFFVKFLCQLKELMVLVLLVSGVVSIVMGVIGKSSSEIVDGAIILGIVVMNALFGVFQERKSERAIDSLKKMTEPECYVLREGKLVKIKTADLVLGDVVCLESGSIVPADLRLFESVNLKINESALTGESDAVSKDSNALYVKEIALADRKNIAYSGSVVENGHGKGIVVALGTESEIGKIAKSLSETKKDMTKLQKDIKVVGKILTYLILLIAGITFILEVIANPNEILNAFLTAVAISVAAIPESLPAVITIIMSLGIAKLSKERAIVKRMHAVETLGACDVICSDKTGTITQNKMTVEKIFTFFSKKSAFFDIFLKNMVLCNDAKIGEKGYVGGSTEVALLSYAKKCGVSKEEIFDCYKRVGEISFSSDRKMMSTANVVDGQKLCFTKGALDRVLAKCKYYADENKILPLTDQIKAKILSQNSKMCSEALRVISFAYKPLKEGTLDENDLIFLGMCALLDPPRKEIFDAVKKCHGAGMRSVMITGDFKETAFAIAKKVGIASSLDEVMSGEEIDKLDDEQFLEAVEKKSGFARVSPAHKVRIVDALKKRGHIVAMTGDGVNDAPSLKKADIGIGMGKTGTDVVKDVADIIITDDNFATIVVAVEEGRKIYSNIQKTIKYLFSANMAEILSLFLITILFPGMTFLLPVQILFVNLITDSLPAIALGTQKVESTVMHEKPRSASSGLLSNGVGSGILFLGLVQTVLTMGAYLFGLFVHGEAVAITMAFYTLNLIQLLYMFTAVTKESCFKSNPFKNKFFNLSLLVGFGLLALMIFTKFGSVLKLQKLSPICWLVVIGLSVSIIFIGEIYKLIEKKFEQRKNRK